MADAIPAPIPTPALGSADARLVELADAYEALDRRCKAHAAAHAHLTGGAATAADDEFDGMVDGYWPIEDEIAATPADTLVGVLAKARACQVPMARSNARVDHILSVIDDLHRILGSPHGAEEIRTTGPAEPGA